MSPRLATVPAPDPSAPAPERWLSDADIARRLAISPAMSRKLRKSGALAFIMVGRLPRVAESDLLEFLKRHRARGGGR